MSNSLLFGFLAALGSGVAVGLMSTILHTLFRKRGRGFDIRVGGVELKLNPDDLDEERIREVLQMQETHPNIMLIYAHPDEEFALRLADDLRKKGANVWTGKENLKVGDRVSNKLRQAVEDSRWVIAVFGSEEPSRWLSKELHIVEESEKRRRRSLLIPVVTDAVPKELVEDRVYADFRMPYEQAFSRLVQGVFRNLDAEVAVADHSDS